jgi:ubiquinone/menaquinone biosynthesis C-methylase UbiE
MNHTDHVNLIRMGVYTGGVWADFGSGGGAFTLALADVLDEDATIYSIDRDAGALNQQRAALRDQFPERLINYMHADFTRKLDLPPLDGVLMANSLHFVRQKEPMLGLVRGYLKPDGRLLIVEYNTDHGNTWVPYPFSFETWQMMANKNGFRDTRLLSARPSRFLGEIYSAVSTKT